MNEAIAIISVIIVSLVAPAAAIPLFLKKKISNKVLLFLLSLAVGALLATVFISLLPEAVSHGYTLGLALALLAGFFLIFIIESLVHRHHSHSHNESHSKHLKERSKKHIAPLVLIGDGFHNFVDGIVIAASYSISIPVGIAATISIIMHEIPQEVGDIGVLLYSGMSKLKALLFNFLSAASAILGTIVGILLLGRLETFNTYAIPFAAGTFLYIAASSLIPELHTECKTSDLIRHLIAIIIGIAIIALVTIYGPAHIHG